MQRGQSADAEHTKLVEQGLLRRYEAVQEMVVDYAIGLAVLGLFRDFLTPVMVITTLLVTKMVWDVGRQWGFAVNFNPISALGQLVNTLGACAIALLAWVSLEFLGAMVPGIESLALSAALMSGAWTLGAAFNTFFMNGLLRRRSRASMGISNA